MKNVLIAIIGVILGTFQFTSDTHADESARVELKQNVRILIEITEGEKPTTTFAIVGSEGNVQLDNIADMVKIDDSLVPTILSFQVTLKPQGDSLYTINYSYGFQRPIITGTTKSKDGKILSRYEYRNLGARGMVTMKIGDKLEILKDPKRSVVLKLERADGINE